MELRKELKAFVWIAAIFVVFYFLPLADTYPEKGLVPSEWVATALGGNSPWANAFASIAGTFMYFVTLTEVPIIQGLMGAGMGKGPALTLLLTGPALSLPSILVINKVMGIKKTFVFVCLVIVFAMVSGLLFGMIA